MRAAALAKAAAGEKAQRKWAPRDRKLDARPPQALRCCALRVSHPTMAKTFTCTFELDKTKGVTVVVRNEGDKVVQTIAMNGTTIITTVKGDKSSSTVTQGQGSVQVVVNGDGDTSSYEQTADRMVTKVKSFVLDAESVEVRTEKDTRLVAGGTLTVKSSKDMTVSSSAKATLKSTGALSLSTDAAASLSASKNLSLKGMNTALEGQQKTTVKGGTAAEVSGMKVDVKGSTQVKLAGLTTEVAGTTTTVKGSMVQVQGLVKLG